MGCSTHPSEYESRIQFYTGELSQLLLKTLRGVAWDSCLDLGCGDGALLYALNQQGYLTGKLVYALDSSAERIKRVKAIRDDFVGLVGDACSIQMQDSSIDLVLSSQVIEHVHSDVDMVKEVRRVLTPGGILYLTTVFKKWYGWYFYRCNGKWALDPTHVREYMQDNQLLGIFRDHGFEVLESRKEVVSRPVLDFALRRLGATRYVYQNAFLRRLRGLKVPIPGYYHWEVVCRKK